MNYRDIIVFDFETGSRNPHKTQPTQDCRYCTCMVRKRLTQFSPMVFSIARLDLFLTTRKRLRLGFDPLEEEALEDYW